MSKKIIQIIGKLEEEMFFKRRDITLLEDEIIWIQERILNHRIELQELEVAKEQLEKIENKE